MKTVIQEVKTKAELKRFVLFPFHLYDRNPNWVPPLIADELATFTPGKNPAYAEAESRQFIALRDSRVVGRIAGILSHVANRKFQTRNLRFGWFDAVDDEEVAGELFSTVEKWARELKMVSITGAHGFCDFDPNGVMIEGFDQMGTTGGNFNYPYYSKLIEKQGFQKEIDYVEFKTFVPHETGIPEKLIHLAERVKERCKFRIYRPSSVRELIKRSEELFDVLGEAYEEIYGAVPLTSDQVRYYIKKYISYIDPKLIQMVVNERDEMLGFLISMPSLTKSFQKARGRLLPFGWFHVLRGLRSREVLEFLLTGIRKKARGQGVDLLMAVEIARMALEMGFVYSESNQELETNSKVQAQWKHWNPVLHKRRRIYKKDLT